MGCVVEANLGGELGWVLEDGGPIGDSLEIIVHVLTGVESLWDLECGKSKLESGLDVVVNSTLFDVGDASLNFLSHELATLVASFNLGEFVVSGHSEDEASNEVWDSHSCDINVREHVE